MTPAALRRWSGVHTWTSLVCTVFLLLICVTGLPLVFMLEISDWTYPDDDPPYAALPANTPHIALGALAERAKTVFPGQIVTNVWEDDDEPMAIVRTAPSWEARDKDWTVARWVKFDIRTGRVLEKWQPPAEEEETRSLPRRVVGEVMGWAFRLHTDLFAGLPGELLMGVMALLFIVAIVSGIVLYGPFTRRLDFGELRTDRSRRVRWLDLHNLLGIVTLAWVTVVGATGLLNELAQPLLAAAHSNVESAIRPWAGRVPPTQAEMVSPQAAFAAARAATPGMKIEALEYPHVEPGKSPHHFMLWAWGRGRVSALLYKSILIDARTGKVTKVFELPWYLTALQVSRPLHFGNYGGLPLKIVWALLDLLTIIVLGSGLYLRLAKRSRPATRRDETSRLQARQLEAAE